MRVLDQSHIPLLDLARYSGERERHEFGAASALVGIENLSEDALIKLSGAKLCLGAGKQGRVLRHCEAMPHPSYIMSAARFVALKEHSEPLSAIAADGALRKLGALPVDQRDHVLSARQAPVGARATTQLAHETLYDFLLTSRASYADVLVMVRDVALALGSLHAVGAYHGDLLSCNVLVSPGGYVLADINGGRLDTGTRRWDMYQLGCLVSHIFLMAHRATSDVGREDATPHSSVFPQLADELNGRGLNSSRAEQVLSRFSALLTQLSRPVFDDTTLLSLAATADELKSILRHVG